MIYVSIDLETTGLDPRVDQVLQVALVVEDTSQAQDVPVGQLPTFECLVQAPGDVYSGSPYALWLNGDLLKALAKPERFDDLGYLGATLRGRRLPIYAAPVWERVAADWLTRQVGPGRVTASGKNAAGFDLQFLSGELKARFLHRVLDPGSAFVDFQRSKLLSLDELKTAYEVEGPVSHDATEDARDVIRLLRKLYT